MKTIVYDILDFKWDTMSNTLRGDANKLYDISCGHYYQIPFPNQRAKFNIKNKRSGGFRRFIYHREYPLSKTECVWIFKSEDGIYCEIIKKIDLY
jgi:hypothetical protein